jgi:hypothetical protein
MTWPRLFCWSKIGPEAGLNLDQIIRWKEFQRSISGGLFFWGIGGTPSRAKQVDFISNAKSPSVLFSEQLGDAKEEYKNPAATLFWTHYLDESGREVSLPRYAAVTSKGGGEKHFAFVCKADAPIKLQNINFDIGLFGNYLGSQNIAFQQTSPIVQSNPSGRPKKLYRRGFWAGLVSPHFATLSRCRQLAADEVLKLRRMMSLERTTVDEFKALIDELKSIN